MTRAAEYFFRHEAQRSADAFLLFVPSACFSNSCAPAMAYAYARASSTSVSDAPLAPVSETSWTIWFAYTTALCRREIMCFRVEPVMLLSALSSECEAFMAMACAHARSALSRRRWRALHW